MKNKFIQVNLEDPVHCEKLLSLLNDYMQDDMGTNGPMPEDLGPKIIEGLKKHKAYIGFFVCSGDDFVALANCNLNCSTWKARFLINIHDFIVSPAHRKQGIGRFLLNNIENYSKEKGYCKINLEVRKDNKKAQRLYRKTGFNDCKPPMHFWQKNI